MAQRITTSLPKKSDKEVARLVKQLHDTDARLRELLGDQVDAVLSSTGATFLLRRAQQKLIQNEAMLAAAQRIAQFGSWEIDLANPEDLNANTWRWSDELFHIFGYEPGKIEANGAHFFQIVHPDDREKVMAAVQQLIRRGKNFEFDHRILLPDGRVRHVREEAEIFIHPEPGRLSKVAGVTHDITDQKEKEQELRLSEERFLSAFEYAPIGMALVLSDGRWLKVNRALCQIVGYTEEELYGHTFQEITHPDDLQQDLELARQMLAGEIHHYELEKRYVHKEGYPVWIQLNVSLVRDDEGEPLYFVSQIQDISGRKMAEQKLAEQAALIDQARDAILERDLENTILFWSKGAERLYGWTAAEVLGQKASDLMYRNAEEFSKAMEILINQGEWTGEMESATKQGAAIVAECRWTLLRDELGNPKSVLCINTDVTERKSLEAHFLRAQRMESIGTLAGGIAHDMNNLLAPILMGVDLLKHFGAATGPCEEVVASIERSAKRGSNLVKQVLSFARGVEGARVMVNMQDVVYDLSSIITDTFPKNITLETKVAAGLWQIMGDPTQLHQVLLNLCLNARDAMPEGGRLTVIAQNQVLDAAYVLTQPAATEGQYISIEVTDTGSGIPPENIEKIFDPFFTTKELGKGTGLGLATALGIVRSHGGFMDVYSVPEKGSTFKIYLPAQIGYTLAANVGEGDEEWPRGNGEWILLVDDEAAILTVTRQMLEAFGYRVITAEHGAQAVGIYALNRETIAVVITDMIMPIMDGVATVAALRQIDPGIKIVAASGLNSKSGITKAGQAGVKHFLFKPYTTGNMLITLRKVLEESNSTKE